MLDGNARLNLATFVTDCLDENRIDNGGAICFLVGAVLLLVPVPAPAASPAMSGPPALPP
jgi:hypothetical protein